MKRLLICLVLLFHVLLLIDGTVIRSNFRPKQRRIGIQAARFHGPGHQRARIGAKLGARARENLHAQQYQHIFQDNPTFSQLPISVIPPSMLYPERVVIPDNRYQHNAYGSSNNVVRSAVPTPSFSYHPYLLDNPPPLPSKSEFRRVAQPMAGKISISDEFLLHNQLETERKNNMMRLVSDIPLQGNITSHRHHSKNNKDSFDSDIDFFSFQNIGSQSMSLSSDSDDDDDDDDAVQGAKVYFIPTNKQRFQSPLSIPSDYSSSRNIPIPHQDTLYNFADTSTTKKPDTEYTSTKYESTVSNSEVSAQNSATKNSTSANPGINEGLSYFSPGLSPLVNSVPNAFSPYAGLSALGYLAKASPMLNLFGQQPGYLNPPFPNTPYTMYSSSFPYPYIINEFPRIPSPSNFRSTDPFEELQISNLNILPLMESMYFNPVPTNLGPGFDVGTAGLGIIPAKDFGALRSPCFGAGPPAATVTIPLFAEVSIPSFPTVYTKGFGTVPFSGFGAIPTPDIGVASTPFFADFGSPGGFPNFPSMTAGAFPRLFG